MARRQNRLGAHGGDRSKIWASMRMLPSFTTAELVATAEAGVNNTTRYVHALARAGYLRKLSDCKSGLTGGHAVWKLVRNTGPHAPRARTQGAVLDINTGQSFVPLIREEAA